MVKRKLNNASRVALSFTEDQMASQNDVILVAERHKTSTIFFQLEKPVTFNTTTMTHLSLYWDAGVA